MPTGVNIKKIRLEKGLTQKQLGDKCGIADSNIRKYESGKQNPKLETLQKIADALEVSIIDIAKDFTLEEYKSTSEYALTLRAVDAYSGVLSILKNMYGKLEEKDVQEEYGESFYYLVGTEKEQFILYEGDIEKIYDYIKNSLPFVVDGLKDVRPESDVIEEIKRNLNDPAYIKRIENFIEEHKKDE